MAYQLRADEIMEALQVADHPRAARLIKMVEEAVNLAAWDLAEHLGVKCGAGDFQGVAFAGLCVPFYPASEGQALPDALEGFDNAEEWEDGAALVDGTGTPTADAPPPTTDADALADWQSEVANGDTRQGFAAWCAGRSDIGGEG